MYIENNRSEQADRELKKLALTGDDIARLMRREGVKIRDIKDRWGVTMKRVREVRNMRGRVAVRGHDAACWLEYIYGRLPGRVNALYRIRASQWDRK